MPDEPGPSSAGLHQGINTSSDTDPAIEEAEEEIEDDPVLLAEIAKERKLRAKTKRIEFLDHLLRELDSIIFLELIAVYYLDCSFFWFFVRAVIHLTLLTPLPDLALIRQHEEHKPFLPLILFSYLICTVLHLSFARPSAGEDTREYLHGGLMIDFIGQKGPTSKLHLALLDICIMVLQMVQLAAHVKRRELKKRILRASGATSSSRSADSTSEAPNNTTMNAGEERNQDADAEERGVLRRTDTLEDAGVEPDEEDALLPSSDDRSGTGSSRTKIDALDALTTGQVMIADLYVIDTLLQEHENYQAFRQSRANSSNTGLSPNTLAQLNRIRVRLRGG